MHSCRTTAELSIINYQLSIINLLLTVLLLQGHDSRIRAQRQHSTCPRVSPQQTATDPAASSAAFLPLTRAPAPHLPTRPFLQQRQKAKQTWSISISSQGYGQTDADQNGRLLQLTLFDAAGAKLFSSSTDGAPETDDWDDTKVRDDSWSRSGVLSSSGGGGRQGGGLVGGWVVGGDVTKIRDNAWSCSGGCDSTLVPPPQPRPRCLRQWGTLAALQVSAAAAGRLWRRVCR